MPTGYMNSAAQTWLENRCARCALDNHPMSLLDSCSLEYAESGPGGAAVNYQFCRRWHATYLVRIDAYGEISSDTLAVLVAKEQLRFYCNQRYGYKFRPQIEQVVPA